MIERITYAMAKGVFRAWLEFRRESHIAVEEVANDEDRNRADRFRDAVRMHQATAGDTRSDDPTSACRAGDSDDLGPHA
jgi:hypothetical protein